MFTFVIHPTIQPTIRTCKYQDTSMYCCTANINSFTLKLHKLRYMQSNWIFLVCLSCFYLFLTVVVDVVLRVYCNWACDKWSPKSWIWCCEPDELQWRERHHFTVWSTSFFSRANLRHQHRPSLCSGCFVHFNNVWLRLGCLGWEQRA